MLEAATGLRSFLRVTLPLSIPCIIVASSMQVTFLSAGLKSLLSTAIPGHVFLAIPFAVLTMKSAFEVFDQLLEKAACAAGPYPEPDPLSRQVSQYPGVGLHIATVLGRAAFAGRVLLPPHRPGNTMTDKPIITLGGVEKRFGGFVAIKDLGLTPTGRNHD
ncbi:ABC transporter permease subunit [Sedimentitalea nanhaiensis]|uniref:Uncharacterized protein n=1 Tax=Sedimentitalea nanhaiensis TaxID=999627 RepID=A0A1I7CSF7_9RHOB|nr:hypothetical protein [Sedimentitalea nanhaiensis]SFU02338.1 hypothetical protein SAMN05216236_11944 [Sedimentitalea nanhaiensis]